MKANSIIACNLLVIYVSSGCDCNEVKTKEEERKRKKKDDRGKREKIKKREEGREKRKNNKDAATNIYLSSTVVIAWKSDCEERYVSARFGLCECYQSI